MVEIARISFIGKMKLKMKSSFLEFKRFHEFKTEKYIKCEMGKGRISSSHASYASH